MKKNDTNLRGQSPSETLVDPTIVYLDSPNGSPSVDANLRGQSPYSESPVDNNYKLNCKKRKIMPYTNFEKRVTSDHANLILKLEEQKVKLAEEMVQLKRIKLMAQLKAMEQNGSDVSHEIQLLTELFDK